MYTLCPDLKKSVFGVIGSSRCLSERWTGRNGGCCQILLIRARFSSGQWGREKESERGAKLRSKRKKNNKKKRRFFVLSKKMRLTREFKIRKRPKKKEMMQTFDKFAQSPLYRLPSWPGKPTGNFCVFFIYYFKLDNKCRFC